MNSVYAKPSKMTALFGVSLTPAISNFMKDLIAFITLLARGLIFLKWKSPATLTHQSSVRDSFYFRTMD